MHFVKINLRSGVFFSRADEARGKKKIRKGILGRGHDLRLCQDLSNARITSKLQHPPLGKPRIFDHHLQRGSGEFALTFACVGWGIWTANVKLNLFLRLALGSAVEPIFGLLTFYIVLKHDALTDLLVSGERLFIKQWEGRVGKTSTPRPGLLHLGNDDNSMISPRLFCPVMVVCSQTLGFCFEIVKREYDNKTEEIY